MVELVDTLDSGSSESNLMEVQVLFSALGSPPFGGLLRFLCARAPSFEIHVDSRNIVIDCQAKDLEVSEWELGLFVHWAFARHVWE